MGMIHIVRRRPHSLNGDRPRLNGPPGQVSRRSVAYRLRSTGAEGRWQTQALGVPGDRVPHFDHIWDSVRSLRGGTDAI